MYEVKSLTVQSSYSSRKYKEKITQRNRLGSSLFRFLKISSLMAEVENSQSVKKEKKKKNFGETS